MKKTLVFAMCTLISTFAYAARDGNLGLSLGYDRITGDAASVSGATSIGASLRALQYTPLELRGEYDLSNGGSAELRLHVFYCDYFALHLLDIGVYIPRDDQFYVRSEVRRNFDFTTGAGLSVFAWKGLEVSARVRWFLPNPASVLPDVARGKYTRDREPEEQNVNTALLNSGGNTEEIVNREEERYRIRGNFAKDVYLDVLRAPAIGISVAWYFF